MSAFTWQRRGVIVVLVFLIVGLVAAGVTAGTVIYVDASAFGANDGSSWTDAYTDLQTALTNASSGDEIWVAKGIYYPGELQPSSFALKDSVALYGGYPTGGGTRDVASNVTVLSGDVDHATSPDTVDANGVTTATFGDNAYHVVTSNNSNNTAVLDGFTITGGNANGSSPNNNGGGMYNSSSSPTVTNCTFSGNSADYGGGGMGNDTSSPTVTNCTFSGNSAYAGGGMGNDTSSPTVTNCTFSGNSANYGGGMYNASFSLLIVTNCTFSGNTANKGGGGMFNDTSSPTLTNCTFSGNTANEGGGGMGNYNSSPALTNCTFSGNDAYAGGGIGNDTSSPTLTNCTFSGNDAYAGGGMGNYNSSPIVHNTILWGDTASSGSNEIYNESSVPTVEYCVVEGGYVGGTNITTDPSLGTLGDHGGTTETIPLLEGSSAIDAAYAAYAPNTDQRGITRPQGSAYDIGAYEAATATTPEMAVSGLGNAIANGDTSPSTMDGTDFGSVSLTGGTNANTFTITNVGDAELNLTDTPRVTIGGAHADDFTLTTDAATSVDSGGGTTTFVVTFDPSEAGVRTAIISIANDDADENPYDFAIQGTGVVNPGMAVRGNSHTITSGDTTASTTDGTDFGSTDIVTGTVDHTFTIESTGTAPLTLTGSPKVAVSGGNAADFTVTAQPGSPVASGGSTTFTIHFDPSGVGVRTATVSIVNNSTDSPYTFAIQGTGVLSSSDVNNDGVINVLDVRLCLQIAEGVIPGTAAQRQQADINADGQVTLVDAQLLADYIIGISH